MTLRLHGTKVGLYLGSAYYDRTSRRNGWGNLFGAGFGRQGKWWEAWLALFGRTFWLGRSP